MAGEIDLVMFILGLCAICLDFLMGTVLLRKVAMIKTSSKRKYYLGVAGFYMAHGTYVLTYVIYKATNNGLLFNFGVMLVLSSLVLLVYSIELSIFRRSRFFFTIFGIVSMGIIAVDVISQAITSVQIRFLGIRLMEWPQYFVNPLLVAFILLVYLYAFMKAAGSVRRNALFMMVGIVLFILAELALSNVAKNILPGVENLGPPLRVVAIVLLSLAIMRLSIWKDESEQRPGTKDIDTKQK